MECYDKSEHKNELIEKAVEKGTYYIDDLYTVILEYLDDMTSYLLITPEELKEIAFIACNQIEEKQAEAIMKIKEFNIEK